MAGAAAGPAYAGAGQPTPGMSTQAMPPGLPVSGAPVSGLPVSGSPISGAPDPLAAPVDPLFPGEGPSWQPRIVPSPPPQRGKLLKGLIIGLACGLLAFGASGFFIGRYTADASAGGPGPTTPTAAPSPTLPPYEQSQRELNAEKFTGDLAAFAEPWLPYVSGCAQDGEPGGPQLRAGESRRVLCEYGAMSLFFVQYKSISERDKVRARNLVQNVEARELAPGVAGGENARKAPSGRSEGSYIEYAFRSDGAPVRTVSGVWWDKEEAPVGAFLLAFWAEGVGEDWEPIRDVWKRHA